MRLESHERECVTAKIAMINELCDMNEKVGGRNDYD